MIKKKNKEQCFVCKKKYNIDEISYPEEGVYSDCPICQQCLADALTGKRILNFNNK